MSSPVKIWRNQKFTRDLLGIVGEVVSWTVIRVPPGSFSDQAPYAVALVKLENGKIIPSQVVDCQMGEVKTGLRVRTILRRVTKPDDDGVISYGAKVKPW